MVSPPLLSGPRMSPILLTNAVTVVDAMLSALEADREGNEMVKREKLRLQIGLKANPA